MDQSPVNESARLAALLNLNVLDTEPEAQFDAIVQAAAAICDVPICLITLVDDKRQWFKANIGIPGVSETPRSVAFCDHTIRDTCILEVEDATQDARFNENPLVTGSPDIRFYAGAPLCLDDGSRVGSLCVIDTRPRRLSPKQREVLLQLTRAASQALEACKSTHSLMVSESRFRALCATSPLGVFYAAADGSCTYTNDRLQHLLGMSQEETSGRGWTRALHPQDCQVVVSEWERVTALQLEFDMEFRLLPEKHDEVVVRVNSRPVFTDQLIGKPRCQF